MRARAILILISLLLLPGCASGPTVKTVRDALEDAGVDVTYVLVYESRDAGWWVDSAERSDIGLDIPNHVNAGIDLYEFSTEGEASQAAQGELPGGPQEASIEWLGMPHLFQRGRLVAIVATTPRPGQLGEQEMALLEAREARVMEVLKVQMGPEVPLRDWSQ